MTKQLERAIEKLLNDPTIHDFTKTIVRVGLTKDCVDAVSDVQCALIVLKKVMDNNFR